jgi:hypothetical protein
LTRARLGEIEAAERALPISELVARAVNEAIVEYSEFPNSTRGSGDVGSKVRVESPESRAKEEV